MNLSALGRWRLAAEILVWRNGWGWPILAAALIASVFIWQFAVMPQRRLQAELEFRLTQLVNAPPMAPPQTSVDLQRVSWQNMREALPQEGDADRLIARMLTLGREQGLVLEQADCQYRDDAELQWLHLSVTVPIRGSYPAARRFIEALLREHPHVALDEISFKRDNAGASQADVVARFSAWFQRDATTLHEAQSDGNAMRPEHDRKVMLSVEKVR